MSSSDEKIIRFALIKYFTLTNYISKSLVKIPLSDEELMVVQHFGIENFVPNVGFYASLCTYNIL